MKKMFQVFEISSNGGCHSVSKCYPSLLGCKRVRNKFACDNISMVGYSYIIREVIV